MTLYASDLTFTPRFLRRVFLNGFVQTGISLFLGGLVFIIAFAKPAIGTVDDHIAFGSSRRRVVQGEVLAHSSVAASGKGNNNTYRTLYAFKVKGDLYRGVSFGGTRYSKGDRPKIEYIQGNPQRARIVGSRRFRSNAFPALLGLGLFLGGIVLFLLSLKRALRRVAFLCCASIAQGDVVAGHLTRSGKSVSLDLDIRYTDIEGNEHSFSRKTSSTLIMKSTPEHVWVFYDPDAPQSKENPLVLDLLGGTPVITKEGEIQVNSTKLMNYMLLANTLGVLVLGLIIYLFVIK